MPYSPQKAARQAAKISARLEKARAQFTRDLHELLKQTQGTGSIYMEDIENHLTEAARAGAALAAQLRGKVGGQ